MRLVWTCLVLALLSSAAIAAPLELVHTSAGEVDARLVGLREVRPDRVLLVIDGDSFVAPRRLATGTPTRDAIVVLLQGTQRWMGDLGLIVDDDHETHSPTPGVLDDLREALDRHEYTVPSTTRRLMGSYGERLMWFEPDRIDGRVPPPRSTYFGDTRTEASTAIRGAIAELVRAPGRRTLVVIGDGCDDAEQEHARAREALAAARVELFAIVYRGADACAQPTIHELTDRVQHVASADAIAAALHAIVQHAGDRVVASFPAASLPWDGAVHRYEVIASGIHYGPVDHRLPDRRARRRTGWWWLAGAGGVLALLGLCWWSFGAGNRRPPPSCDNVRGWLDRTSSSSGWTWR